MQIVDTVLSTAHLREPCPRKQSTRGKVLDVHERLDRLHLWLLQGPLGEKGNRTPSDAPTSHPLDEPAAEVDDAWPPDDQAGGTDCMARLGNRKRDAFAAALTAPLPLDERTAAGRVYGLGSVVL